MGQSTPPLSDGVQGTVQSSSSSSTNNKYNNSSSSTDDLQSRSLLLRIILSKHEEDDNSDNSGNNNNIRNLSLTTALQSLTTYDVLREVQVLDEFRRTRRSSSSSSSEEEEEESSTNNLYERVRALFFLYAVHRFHLPERRKIIVNKLKLKKRKDNGSSGSSNYDDGSVGTDTDNTTRQHQKILNEENDDTTATNLKDEEMVFCPRGYAALLDRRFDESIDHFLASVSTSSSTIPISPNDDDYESNNNNNNSDIKDKEEGREYRHVTPRRTSLLSNLTFSRMGSSATTSSSIDSELSLEYSTYNDGSRDGGSANHMMSSTRSSLEGERLLSSATIRSSASARQTTSVDDDGNDDNEKQPTMLLLPSDATSSALAKSYRELAFQTLANQVKTSVRLHPGNEWMFTLKNVNEQPLRWSKELFLAPNKYKEEEGEEGNNKNKGCYQQPILLEKTPVRMDLSHSCWSDIFFLGMDYPEAARVINCSVDLSVQRSPTTAAATHDDDSNSDNNALPKPPIECKLQLTTSNPGTIRLTSVDLQTSVLLTHVSQVFNYGADYLGLLKAGIVACGIVPLGLEKQCCGSVDGKKDDMLIKDLLMTMMPSTTTTADNNDGGECLYGLELTTNVHNIPKGSRLAVSTNLLGSIIAVGMRATQQTKCLTGPLVESERRLVAARAILGEWLGGSGGGWQDSGGVWPGLKLIHGVKSREGDPEYGISRGCLLPQHRLLNKEEAPESLLYALEQSLVLVHGGMAQNVG